MEADRESSGMSGNHRIARVHGWAGLVLAALGGCVPQVSAPDFASWPVDTAGYAIEVLPWQITCSFAHGPNVFLGLPDGRILRVRDDDLSQPPQIMSGPTANPWALLVMQGGDILTAAPDGPLYRSSDGGVSWQISLDVPIWRMEEDDLGNLYTGNYTKTRDRVATLYKSQDSGATWQVIWQDPGNDHIHTVRWDDQAKRLYFSFGDKPQRGQGYSDDRGGTFTILARDAHQGHTDVTFTRDYVFWASDDQSGRVFRVDRQTNRNQVLMGRSQFMWFAVAGDYQVYVGTQTSRYGGGERAALLASPDQGQTWQKLLETAVSTGPYDQGFTAESRRLTSNGWLYLADKQGASYRLRRQIVTAH
jgi:hypothetical protein